VKRKYRDNGKQVILQNYAIDDSKNVKNFEVIEGRKITVIYITKKINICNL